MNWEKSQSHTADQREEEPQTTNNSKTSILEYNATSVNIMQLHQKHDSP